MTKDSSDEVCILGGSWSHAGDVEKFPQFYYSATSGRSSLADNTGKISLKNIQERDRYKYRSYEIEGG